MASKKRRVKRKPGAKTKKPGTTKKKPTTKPKAKRRARKPKLAASIGLAFGGSLYDVICPVENVVATDLKLGIARDTAREHNQANPGHDAQAIRQG